VQLRNKFFTVLPAILLAGTVACGDDDNGTGNGNGNGPGNGDGGVDPGDDVIVGDPTDLSGRGDWGGFIMSGFGIDNDSDENGELTSEASPPDSPRWFGGNDNSDSSGTMTYTIIAETGFEFQENEEVQGLTLEAVGSGTTLDFIQILGSEDDCIEWFGGEAGMTHAICNGVDDDGLDIDEGYVGNIQYAIVRQGAQNGDRGIESDSKFALTPVTAPNIANVTILGNAGKEGNDTFGALHREGFAGKVFRSVYTDDLLAGTAFEDGCVDIDDLLPMELEYRDVVMNCTPAALHDDDDTEPDPENPDVETSDGPNFQTDAEMNGQLEFVVDNDLTIMDTLAVMTSADAPSTPLPSGLDDVSYYGAVDPSANEGWWEGWTYIDPAVDGGLPGGSVVHPLEDDITSGAITPAGEHLCSSVNDNFTNGGFVTVFGAEFPVCVMPSRINADTSLPNNHIFVFNDFLNVGTGEEQLQGGEPSSSVTLTIEAGTQVYAQQDTGAFLVITRGSELDAQGSAAQPIIFGAVDMDL